MNASRRNDHNLQSSSSSSSNKSLPTSQQHEAMNNREEKEPTSSSATLPSEHAEEEPIVDDSPIKFYDSLFYDDVESRLWENDSSYLVAVSPKIFENNRIRLKVILGYRVQSVVHALPSPVESDAAAVSGHLLPYDRYNRRRLYQSYYTRERLRNMSPEEFNQLPEHQQRRILKERFQARRLEQRRGLKDSLVENDRYGNYLGGGGSFYSWNNFMYWASRNLEQLGWKSLLGVVAFVFGLYRATTAR
ncbi:hypothetical protein FDP41_000069 [Naegleria fowleri]|uniref:Uncharacterized protein n=1 Tax=Naegleria fowleri TaxID=5763 RepID=A0A6A5CHQ9_NAEFO|nr:uncharacterized protein FDP41_000069 [Naegleria fowleri]KAF0985030.1 hypothetical protein FDP41_000069 [Naegleria fowleri]CAG4717910.1 unnamed protein product [Naegleria fowleri]